MWVQIPIKKSTILRVYSSKFSWITEKGSCTERVSCQILDTRVAIFAESKIK